MPELYRFLVSVLFAGMVLSGCSSNSITNAVRPFRIDVRQGNFISQEMVAQLTPGQTKEQVRFIMGSPLLMDVFHADRWDYVYQFSPGRGAPQRRWIALIFSDSKLVRVEGDVVAADASQSKTEITQAVPRVIEIDVPGSKR